MSSKEGVSNLFLGVSNWEEISSKFFKLPTVELLSKVFLFLHIIAAKSMQTKGSWAFWKNLSFPITNTFRVT